MGHSYRLPDQSPPQPAVSESLYALWGDVEHGLRQVLSQVAGRLDLATTRDIEALLDHNELGVAAESLTYCLAQAQPPLSDPERDALWSLGARMDIDLSEWEKLGRQERNK